MKDLQDDPMAAELLQIFREKYWEIYRFTDNKRVKSLYYLIIVSFIFMLSLIGESNVISVIGFSVKKDIAIVLIPLIVWLFTIRYQFLSALSLGNFSKFNKIYEAWRKRIEGTRQGESIIGMDFRPDDLNEFPNMYRQAFIKINKSKIKEVKGFWEILATIGTNIIYYSLNFISIIVYVVTSIYVFNATEPSIDKMYLALGLITLILITIFPHIYFYKKTTLPRNWLSN